MQLEVGNHALDLGDPSALFIDLKLLQADQRFHVTSSTHTPQKSRFERGTEPASRKGPTGSFMLRRMMA